MYFFICLSDIILWYVNVKGVLKDVNIASCRAKLVVPGYLAAFVGILMPLKHLILKTHSCFCQYNSWPFGAQISHATSSAEADVGEKAVKY